MGTRFLAPPWSRPPSPSPVGGCGWGFGEPFLAPVGVVEGDSPPLWVWLGLGGMKRHDLRSSHLSCGWVWVSQMEELREHL